MILSLLILLASIATLVWMRRDAKGRDWSRSSWIKTHEGWSILAFCIGIGALPYYLQQRAKCARAAEPLGGGRAGPVGGRLHPRLGHGGVAGASRLRLARSGQPQH